MSDVNYTVTELMTATADAIKARLGGAVWVDGEISGARESRGHFYFDLVDRDEKGAVTAKVPVALWSRARPKVEQKLQSAGTVRLEEGVKVRIRGPLELWLAGGRLQLSMQDIDPAFTLEALESERERVLAVLRAENLIDRNRSLALAPMPLHIALITADESAAQADFMHSLIESRLPWRVEFIDSKVQGAGAERTIAAALRTAQHNKVDVIALVRGGGSRLDLAIFDHEVVARAIATSSVPVSDMKSIQASPMSWPIVRTRLQLPVQKLSSTSPWKSSLVEKRRGVTSRKSFPQLLRLNANGSPARPATPPSEPEPDSRWSDIGSPVRPRASIDPLRPR